MSDLTQNEIRYRDLFLEMKQSIPTHDVSVFKQPLETREDLLKTILCRWDRNDTFRLASEMNYTNQKRMPYGRRADFYSDNSYPFWKFKTEKDFSDLLCAAITHYLPRLTLPDSIQAKEGVSQKEEFLRHYEASIELLLRGPPHANEHQIDEVLAEKWISSQKTPERRRLARKLIEKTLYISHNDLLREIQNCVEKTKEKLIDGPVVLIVGTKHKSNYYIALLFYHFWTKAGLPVDTVKSYLDEFVPGNILDVDEMAYSGTQTTGTLANVYGRLITLLKKWLDEHNASAKKMNKNIKIRTKNKSIVKGYSQYDEPVEGKYILSYAKTPNFLPVCLVESLLNKSKINYIVIRIFCSEVGELELRKMPPVAGYRQNAVKPPFHLVLGKQLPSPSSLFGKEDAEQLGTLFGHPPGYPAAAVYFNHKVADIPSTYLFAYSYGVIPDRVLNESEFNENVNNSVDEIAFLPFIRFCGEDERPMPRTRENLLNYKAPGENQKAFRANKGELPQRYRCPYAWYKGIDYERGIYNPPRIGGKRTRKGKRHSKQQTRSTSK